jgi:LAS superfamily LD-carboxypeptidase LdcB
VSVTNRKKRSNLIFRGRKKHPQAQPENSPPVAAAQPSPRQPSPDFERELQDHFAAEERKKVEEATEHIFGSVLARHGWVRNEHGQVEYVGGDGV